MPFAVAIIDDEDSIRRILRRILEVAYGDSVTIHEASTVEGGKHLVRNHHPNVVILDGSFYSAGQWNSEPVITEVLAQKDAEPNYKVKIIAISSYPDINDEMVKAGCDQSVLKSPLSMSLSVIKAAVDSVRPS